MIEIIRIKAILKSYNNSIIINRLSLDIKKGDFVSIVGESGAGKSTLLNIIGLLEDTDEGTYYLNDKEMSSYQDREKSMLRNREFGFMFQNSNLLSHLTVYENIELPLAIEGMEIEKRNFKITELLIRFGIEKLSSRDVMTLSGGEKQRVALCRALINNPSIILCDEPTGNLDDKNKKIIIDELKRLNNQGKTILLVTHDYQLQKYAKKKYIFEKGTLKEWTK